MQDQARQRTGRKCSRLTQTGIKQEPNVGPARAVGISDGTPTDSTVFPSWGVPSTFPNPYEQLSTKIVDFLRLGARARASTDNVLSSVFTADNVRQFLDNFTHFHTHFSILHIPTFRIMEAYIGLVASMCCIGACYADRVNPTNTREVMEYLDGAIEASSPLFASIKPTPQTTKYEEQTFGSNKTDIEELQAIVLDQVLLTWHGSPVHRDKARATFPYIASFARRSGLLRVSHSPSLYSQLHQPDFVAQGFNASSFDWQSWVDQEKRIRIMYFIFLSDTALGLYFNRGPELNTFEIHLPLPADDAAWDASTSAECAEALGLHGPHLAKLRNPDGTQRCNQPELDRVLRALLDSNYQIQPGATNLYGKFILIHALLAMMRRVQLDGSAALNKGSDSPLPQNSWFVGLQGGETGPNINGRSTPVQLDAGLMDRPTVKVFATALEKFKANWDNDMAAQFPPTLPVHHRRYGFSKDGIHFYWLANYILKNTRAADLRIPSDQRFIQVMHMLKSVRSWVLSDNASRGEELGSIADIEPSYAATNTLHLDLTQLFRPLPRATTSPGNAAGQ